MNPRPQQVLGEGLRDEQTAPRILRSRKEGGRTGQTQGSPTSPYKDSLAESWLLQVVEAEKTKGSQKVGGGVAYTIGKFHTESRFQAI